VELGILIVALLVLGSLVRSGHFLPQEIAMLRTGQRLDLPYTKEDIKMIYRVLGTWRVEHVCAHRDALTQHFEVVTPPYSQTRKALCAFPGKIALNAKSRK
jgi:hypothetical protein